MSKPRIVLLGGGYVGLYCALELERALAPSEADVVVVSQENFMLYWPLLVEVASGDLDPRDVVVPLRKALRRSEVITATATAIDSDRRQVRRSTYLGDEYELGFDQLVIGLGSRTRLMPVAGLEQQAIGFLSVAEALPAKPGALAAGGGPVNERREGPPPGSHVHVRGRWLHGGRSGRRGRGSGPDHS